MNNAPRFLNVIDGWCADKCEPIFKLIQSIYLENRSLKTHLRQFQFLP